MSGSCSLNAATEISGAFGAILFVEWSLVLAVGNACEATYIDNPDGVMYAVSWLFAFLLLLVL